MTEQFLSLLLGLDDDLAGLLRAGADPNARLRRPGRLILEGVDGLRKEFGRVHPEMLAPLLERKCDDENTDQFTHTCTPLLVAVAIGDEKAVGLLLAHGADMNYQGADGASPLLLAVKAAREDLVDQLLAAGADPDVSDASGYTPLMHAAAMGHPKEYSGHAWNWFWISEGRNTADARERFTRIAFRLLAADANVHAVSRMCYDTAFLLAVYHGTVSLLTALLDRGADINAANSWGGGALDIAAAGGRLDLLRLLLDRGADINLRSRCSYFPLRTAVSNEDTGALQLLLERGADVHARQESLGYTALFDAASSARNEAVRLLLAHGADVNAPDKWGNTPLMAAAGPGFEATVRLLLSAGADPRARNLKGQSALDISLGESPTEKYQTWLRAKWAREDQALGSEGLEESARAELTRKRERIMTMLSEEQPGNAKDVPA